MRFARWRKLEAPPLAVDGRDARILAIFPSGQEIIYTPTGVFRYAPPDKWFTLDDKGEEL